MLTWSPGNERKHCRSQNGHSPYHHVGGPAVARMSAAQERGKRERKQDREGERRERVQGGTEKAEEREEGENRRGQKKIEWERVCKC